MRVTLAPMTTCADIKKELPNPVLLLTVGLRPPAAENNVGLMNSRPHEQPATLPENVSEVKPLL